MEMSAYMKAELASTCSFLGRLHGGKYEVDRQCYESVRDLVRFLRRDDSFHEVRLYLGDAKVLQTDLVHIATVVPPAGEVFDLVIRLLVSLTSPVILLYKEEEPVEKTGRNIYMRLIAISQEYKMAFCNEEFWKVICTRLTDLFEIDWVDRSEDNNLQIERMLVLLRNVLQVPADTEFENRPDNDITVHDKVLWALRESQLLELLLYVSSNQDEEQYFLHLLEIFSLVLREQSPGELANCKVGRSIMEKERDAKELTSLREKERAQARSFKNTRNFVQTFVVKNVKSISKNEIVYHKSLDKFNDLKLTQDKKRVKTPKNKRPEDSERLERRSTFSVRLFLKEFCMEFLSCSFNKLMGVVKDKLISGKGLSNDESYYFWALKFFLEFSSSANVDIKLISECLNVQTFHFVQTQIDNCYDHIQTDKKKIALWVRRLHLALKAYRSLLQSFVWMDGCMDTKIREVSKVLKSNIFYVVEYRELLLNCLFKYDSGKFPLSFLRDLIETNHLNLKLLEHHCKTSKIVVQKKKRVIKKRSKKTVVCQEVPPVETALDKWEKIKDSVFDLLEKGSIFPEIAPFDAASSVPIDDQKEDAMKNIQKYLRKGDLEVAIGLLRSSRQVWPENDCFGNNGMSVEDEVMALQEICLADLGETCDESMPVKELDEENEEEEESDREDVEVIEQNFDMQDYIKKLANKKVVEGCCVLLSSYKKNSAFTNHCVVKLLHRIGWECKVPTMMYQASFFLTLHRILLEKVSDYKEIQHFAKQLFKMFRKNSRNNPKIFMELLFWKDAKTAVDIETGYDSSEEKKEKKGVWTEEEEDELRRLWVEFDQAMLGGDKIDWIRNNLINQSRSRLAVIKKLKDLMLIAPGVKVSKRSRGGVEWTEAETSQLAQLFEENKEALDVIERIRERMTFARSKKSIRDKLLDMGLVNSRAELRKKKPRKNVTRQTALESSPERRDSATSSEEDSDSEQTREVSHFSLQEAIHPLKKLEDKKDWLKWLKETYEDHLLENNFDGYPLLDYNPEFTLALEDENFVEVLRKLNIKEPEGQQMYWKIQHCNKEDICSRIKLITAAIDGSLEEVAKDLSVEEKKKFEKGKISDDSDSEDEFEKLKRVMPAAVSRDGSRLRNKAQEVSHEKERRLDDEFDKLKNSFSEKAVIKPSRKAYVIQSDDDDEREVSAPVSVRSFHTLDSDRSDKGGESGEEMELDKGKKKKPRRQACLASDSEGEETPREEQWRQKRRRCIGSDSEIEGNPSDEEERQRPLEVRKKSRMLDSDSDLDNNSLLEDR